MASEICWSWPDGEEPIPGQNITHRIGGQAFGPDAWQEMPVGLRAAVDHAVTRPGWQGFLLLSLLTREDVRVILYPPVVEWLRANRGERVLGLSEPFREFCEFCEKAQQEGK